MCGLGCVGWGVWVEVCGLVCVGVSAEIPVRSLIRQGQNKAKVYTGGRGGGGVGVGGGGEQARNSHTTPCVWYVGMRGMEVGRCWSHKAIFLKVSFLSSSFSILKGQGHEIFDFKLFSSNNFLLAQIHFVSGFECIFSRRDFAG